MGYKSDAVALLADSIDKETKTQTAAGEQLNVDNDAVADVQNQIEVIAEPTPAADTAPTPTEDTAPSSEEE